MNAATDRTDGEWLAFPGGELEARRPTARCAACRRAERPGESSRGPLCFQCYRAEIDRRRALDRAAHLDTGSIERFQNSLPFEPVDTCRLEQLKSERNESRRLLQSDAVGRSIDKRRRAQIAARHALVRLAAGLTTRQLAPSDQERARAAAAHAAELQLPEAWLPFVMRY